MVKKFFFCLGLSALTVCADIIIPGISGSVLFAGWLLAFVSMFALVLMTEDSARLTDVLLLSLIVAKLVMAVCAARIGESALPVTEGLWVLLLMALVAAAYQRHARCHAVVTTGPVDALADASLWAVHVLCFNISAFLFVMSFLLPQLPAIALRCLVSALVGAQITVTISLLRRGMSPLGGGERVRNYKIVSVTDFAYQGSGGMSDTAMTRLYAKLEEKMRDEKYYLDESLDLESLSTLMLTNKSYMSKTINTCSGSNFRQYLNAYRVDYALALMKEGPHKKMEDVAYMSGFHNVVSFNMAFKYKMKCTPTEWLEEYRMSNM